jgi:hypothetical protein
LKNSMADLNDLGLANKEATDAFLSNFTGYEPT